MAGKQSVNSFQEGMKQDVDILLSNNKAYRYSIGGRLMYNKDGTYSWEVENGNKISFNLIPSSGVGDHIYVPLGDVGNSNIRIIFSHDPTDNRSEIGIFSIADNGNGTYKTLFNDWNDDPNGDRLNFLTTNQIEARFVYENDSCIRVYWVDGVEDDSNQPRVFTFKYDRTIGNASDVTAYSAVTTSVHAMDSQSEFDMGIIKFDRTISGGIDSGVYQYTYSLGTKDGYNTPWYPLTRTIFVTSDGVSDTNWNKYEMEGSGISTSKGNRIEIKGIDQKFDTIRVAYVYSVNPNTTNHANIFSTVDIDSATMSFDHVANDGEPLLIDEITSIFSGIRAAKTLNIKDSTLYYGNVIEGILGNYDTDAILANVTVKPVFRDMRSDEKRDSVSGTNPVTNQPTKTGTTTIPLHNDVGGDQVYNIVGDYINYKGTQVEHLFTGYFRGETYRYAIVFYDKIGFPSFAAHLCDIQFPDQAGSTYTANRVTSLDTVVNVAGGALPLGIEAYPTNNFGSFGGNPVLDGENTGAGIYSHLRIMGLEVSGIDISSISSEISGFKIVRAELDQTIQAQGLLYPCVRQNEIARPFPFGDQDWTDPVLGVLGPTSDPKDIILSRYDMLGATQPLTVGTTTHYSVRSNLSVFYTPEYDFDDSKLPVVQSQDELKLVGGCFADDNGSGELVKMWATNSYATRNKLYYSKNDFHKAPTAPYPTYLDSAGIEASWVTPLGGDITDYEPGLDINNSVEFENGSVSYPAGEFKGWGKGKAIFYKHHNFGPDNTFSPLYKNNFGGINSSMGFWICNYVRPNANPYGGLSLSALETTIFFGTGHFQPIGNSSFAQASGDIYDGIEVWGGDCYLDYFGFQRTYNRMEGGNPTTQPFDYGLGTVFPWESKLNHALRQAASQDNPMFTDVGTRTYDEYDGLFATPWPNGLFHFDNDNELLEEFNFNDVLLKEELLQFYTPKPINFKDNSRFPVRWRYTPNKVYGDPTDTWRTFQVNDFHDLNGEYGEITSSLYIFNQIYSWQLSAFGRLRASDRALLESPNAGTLTTGIGDKLDGIDYISTIEGNQHQWSLFSSGKAAYWINVDMHSIMRFAQDGQTSLDNSYSLVDFSEETFGMFQDVDNPAWMGGIVGRFDHHNGDAIWSLVYDEYLERNGNLRVESIRTSDISEVYENNQTIYYQSTGIYTPTTGIYFPEGETINGENNNSIYYVRANGLTNIFGIFTEAPDGTATKLTDVQIYECWRVSRNSNTDAWTAEMVDIKESSPEPHSLSFNENLNAFQGFHAWEANYLMSHKDVIISQNWSKGVTIPTGNRYWIHDANGKKNTFYDEEFKAILTSVVNEGPMLHKIFDDVRVNCNEEASKSMIRYLMETETQSYYFDIQTDTRQKYLEDILRFPIRTKIQKDRTRGKHLKMTFEFLNNSFKSTRLTNLVTFFRNSNRI